MSCRREEQSIEWKGGRNGNEWNEEGRKTEEEGNIQLRQEGRREGREEERKERSRGKKEGRKEGEKEGKEDRRKEGREEGRKEWRRKGKKEGREGIKPESIEGQTLAGKETNQDYKTHRKKRMEKWEENETWELIGITMSISDS